MPGCFDNKGAYPDNASETGTDRTYSLLLAAFMAQRTVKVFYNYKSVAPGYNGWDLCSIEAVDMR